MLSLPRWCTVFFARLGTTAIALLCIGAVHAQTLVGIKPSWAHGDAVMTPSEGVLPATGGGVNYLMSNQPAAFNGLVINDFLGADRFYDAGITGQNAIVGNVEAGHIWSGHATLGHVSQFSHHTEAFGSSTDDLFDRHATWVGHMIGGRNGGTVTGDWQPGIAPGAELRSGAVASSWAGSAYSLGFSFTDNSFVQPYAAFFGTADVINSSWGFTDATGTHQYTIAMDGMAAQNPSTTFVVAAGNSGPNPNTVGSPGSGYNSITVGALGNANAYDQIASFSSRGPQSYADPVNGTFNGIRAAVDIVAPGQNLTGAFYGGQTGGNNPGLPNSAPGNSGSNLYSPDIAGTSFAAPIVAGGAALLHSYANTNPAFANGGANEAHDARVIKAVLLNSADKLAGWNNGQALNGDDQIITSQSLDYALGAGAMNLDRAYTQYIEGETGITGATSGDQGRVDAIGWDLGSVTESAASLFDNYYILDGMVEAGTTITATLAWFRDRTFDTNTPEFDYEDVRQADLDLYIFATDATGTALGDFVAGSLSGVNVVEHLSFDFLESGYYGIGIDYFGNNFGTDTTISYGLAWATTVIPEPTTLLTLAFGVLSITRRRRTLAV